MSSNLSSIGSLIIGEFFHGWRRQMGCVTLILACLLMGLWSRTFTTFDYIVIRNQHIFCSGYQSLMWARTDGPGLPNSPFWFYEAETGPWGPVAEVDGELGFGFKWRGFQFGAGHTAANQPCQIWAIPFLAAVIPLTLISAFLLLFNPPVVKPKVAGEASNPDSPDNALATKQRG